MGILGNKGNLFAIDIKLHTIVKWPCAPCSIRPDSFDALKTTENSLQ